MQWRSGDRAGAGPVFKGIREQRGCQFPASINFKVSAQDDVKITEIRLQYSIDMSVLPVSHPKAFVAFPSSTNVNTQWNGTLPESGLAAGDGDQVRLLLKMPMANTMTAVCRGQIR